MSIRNISHATLPVLPLGLVAAMAVGTLVMPSAAFAYRWDLPDRGIQIDFNTTMSYGVQVRVQDPDRSNIGNDNGGRVPVVGDLGTELHGPGGGSSANPDFNFLNGDNGNLNYEAGDITSAALKGLHELGAKWGNGWEFLGRMSWLYDHEIANTRRTQLSSDAKDVAELNLTPLDLWVSKDFDLFGQPAKVRLGNQVVSWGEDIFIIGGINSINALDIRRFRTPGTQIKEVLRPAPMLYLNTGISEGLSFEAYYQFMWNSFRLDPVGTLFSGADIAGKGQLADYFPSSLGLCGPSRCGDGIGQPILPGGNVLTQVRKDREPDSTGQFGMALRYIPSAIDMEFAFYYIHYHDKLPFTALVFDPRLSSIINPTSRANALGLGYFNEYGEDKDLFGLSMNTKVGPIAVGSELSYRPKDSVAIDPSVPTPAGLAAAFGLPFNGLKAGSQALGHSLMDGVSCGLGTGDAITPGPRKTFDAGTCGTTVHGYVEEEKWQANLTGFYFVEIDSIFGRMMRALGAAEGYALAEIAATYYPNLDTRNIPYLIFPSYKVPDKISAGYVFEIGLTYPHALFGFNVAPQIDFTHDVSGTSPNTIPFVKGRKSLFLGVNFDKDRTWRGQIGYTTYFGGGFTNIISDRDFFGASASFSF